MELMEWDESYCTGIKSFDEQHKVLFGLIGKLLAGMMENREKEAVSDALDALLEYTKDHFAAEEKEMIVNDYPDYKKHSMEHQRLLNEVVDYFVKFRSGGMLPTADLIRFLSGWLKNHILLMDMEYAPYLIKKGVK